MTILEFCKIVFILATASALVLGYDHWLFEVGS